MPTKAQEQKPFKKGGVVIYGNLSEGKYAGERALVAPYNEGRFGDSDKYYVLPKGGIDSHKGETPQLGAVRETNEESGVDIILMCCASADEVAAYKRDEKQWPAAFRAWMDGTPTTNLKSAGYPGVTILHAEPEPVDHSYLSRMCKPSRTAMYGIEVAGIEHLRGALKNPKNVNSGDEIKAARVPIRDIIGASPERYPTFRDFLTWLRTEKMPQGIWNASWDKAVLPLFPEEGKLAGNEWFRKLEKKYNHGRPIGSREQWQNFCATIPGPDFHILTDCIGSIKKQLGDMGLLEGDHGFVKLDDKDCPLHYYQEGADIITAEQYIASCLDRMRANPDYAKAFGGHCERKQGVPAGHELLDSQLVAVTPFLSKEDIQKGIERFVRETELPFLAWGQKRPARQAGFSIEEPMLAKREELQKSWCERQQHRSEAVAALG